MVKVQVSDSFPKCLLIDQLIKKVNERTDTTFNFYGHLDNLRHTVSGEVRYINCLFPEYTPHDEEYHLRRLFHVADTVLGEHIIKSMNATELFLLAVSLYGHDWGMAVSLEEKDAITGKISPIGFALMHNEQEAFRDYLLANGLGEDFDPLAWQEYVRKTHAQRSGYRIIKYFETIDLGVGEAASRISEGHWLDLKQLTDYSEFPTNFSVLSENINLRALAIYLRLIDLFDIGSDRTPYVIWKYVSPRNEISRMEWAKHRALQPITCTSYQDGRVIIVDGSTDDHNVYASIMDLKNYCNEQLRGCSDILAQMNDPYHNLNIYHAEWRIKARNFKAISIQFEFDRVKMFEVLSDEIYKSDVYVFLRELLQNSIDAIKMRKEVLASKGLYSNNIGNINITVNKLPNGDLDIIFKDDGIGMDEYIVKNYLSIAGKSYYSSSDFKKLGLNMDPISRFGVGILSCFMVADEIEIETYREPYLSSIFEKLKIKIPSVDKQFRIEATNPTNSPVGTTITVKLLGKKLEEKGFSKAASLEVTKYISKIAGFIDYPIFINENGEKAVVLSPDIEGVKEQAFIDAGLKVFKIDLSFPFEHAFDYHFIEIGREKLSQQVLDLKSDLKLSSVSGKLVFVKPKESDSVLRIDNLDSTLDIMNKKGIGLAKLKVKDNWMDSDNKVEDGEGGNKIKYFSEPKTYNYNINDSSRIKIFVDGILVTEAYDSLKLSQKFLFQSYHPGHDVFTPPFLVINIKKELINRLDLSRTRIISREESFADIIIDAYEAHVKKEITSYIFELPLNERLIELANLVIYKLLSDEWLEKIVGREFLPIAMIDGNSFILKEVKDIADHEVRGLPMTQLDIFPDHFTKMILEDSGKREQLMEWKGELCVVDSDICDYDNVNARTMCGIVNRSLNLSFVKSRVEFLQSFENCPPFIRNVYVRRQSFNVDLVKLLEKSLNGIKDISNEEIEELEMVLYDNGSFVMDFSINKFSQPYAEKLLYGTDIFNFNHPFIQSFIPLYIAFHWHRANCKMNYNISRINYLINNLPLFTYISRPKLKLDELNDMLNQIFDLAYKEGIVKAKHEEWKITLDDFVDDTVVIVDGYIVGFWYAKMHGLIQFDDEVFAPNLGKPLV